MYNVQCKAVFSPQAFDDKNNCLNFILEVYNMTLGSL